ncbi:unnamed protein product, partial [Mesorhabditis spiculigera]
MNWLRTKGKLHQPPATLKPSGTSQRSVGIGGIERRLEESNRQTQNRISHAFEDLSVLMDEARTMVGLSRSIAEKMRAMKGSVSDNETIEFKSYLLSLGVANPVTKEMHGSGARYFEKLAAELSDVLKKPLEENGGMMLLPEAFCRLNRARGEMLVSPEDLLNACKALEKIQTPIELHRFASGVLVIQLKAAAVEKTISNTEQLVLLNGSLSAAELAATLGITVILAKERMIAAEKLGLLCRDDTFEGLRFFPNKFCA